jgi:hypothetical protein
MRQIIFFVLLVFILAGCTPQGYSGMENIPTEAHRLEVQNTLLARRADQVATESAAEQLKQETQAQAWLKITGGSSEELATALNKLIATIGGALVVISMSLALGVAYIMFNTVLCLSKTSLRISKSYSASLRNEDTAINPVADAALQDESPPVQALAYEKPSFGNTQPLVQVSPVSQRQ